MKQFLSKYYPSLACAIYLIGVNFKIVTSFDIVAIILLAGYSAFKLFFEQKGKILDRDAVLIAHNRDFEALKQELSTFKVQHEYVVKELTELRSKLSIATTKDTRVASNVKW